MIKKKQQAAKVITPAGMKPKPRQHERDAAEILAVHFNTFIEFLPRTNGKSADFIIDGVIWELKSPTGTGKHNIKRQLQYAKHQSVNVIIDLLTLADQNSIKLKSGVKLNTNLALLNP